MINNSGPWPPGIYFLSAAENQYEPRKVSLRNQPLFSYMLSLSVLCLGRYTPGFNKTGLYCGNEEVFKLHRMCLSCKELHLKKTTFFGDSS